VSSGSAGAAERTSATAAVEGTGPRCAIAPATGMHEIDAAHKAGMTHSAERRRRRAK